MAISLRKWFKVAFSQLCSLVKKNTIIAVRNWPATFLTLLCPLLFVSVLFFIQILPKKFLGNDSTLSETPLYIPKCHPQVNGKCSSLVYAPTIETNNQIMEVVASQNYLNIYYYNKTLDNCNTNNTDNDFPDDNASIIGFNSEHDLYCYLNGTNRTQGAVLFSEDNSFVNLNYKVFFNATCRTISILFPSIVSYSCTTDYTAQITFAVDQATITILNNNTIPKFNFSWAPYPLVPDPDDAIKNYGPLLFFCCNMIYFMKILVQLSLEKENKLKQGMRVIGLKSSIYWFSWFITTQIMIAIITLILMATGFAYQFSFFLKTDFGVNFFLFYLFTTAMIQLSTLVSTILQSTRAAIIAGLLILLSGLAFTMTFSILSSALIPAIYNDTLISTFTKICLGFIPIFHFTKAIIDISSVCFSFEQHQGSYFYWQNLTTEYILSNGATAPPTIYSFYWQLVLIVGFSFLTWYFDNVISAGQGSAKPWYFLVSPEFWGLTKKKSHQLSRSEKQFKDAMLPDDIAEETRKAKRSINAMLRCVDLTKIYHNSSLLNSLFFKITNNYWYKPIPALSDFNLALESDQIFVILGQNGAGKSTLMHLLTGLFLPTSGDAFIGSFSVVSETDRVREVIGVCPQYDILWADLTAREHIELFAGLRNMKITVEEIEYILSSVNLKNEGNYLVKSFSGGMKRRLSLALSSIGDPRLIVMDEPVRIKKL
eukprot:TRINITY_DN3807_c0_g1_i4.p1 TRINITY_DN3807_c0_g1~~TRINITY_DN3807_c0_g1_i4.p1  ORF type:complete len:711 (-),score=230.70 TRINITY_DN3807_c0_g1_i4:60-2192(-)